MIHVHTNKPRNTEQYRKKDIVDDKMKTWWFTFGIKYDLEPHPVLGAISSREVVVVNAESWLEARKAMIDLAGTYFAFQHDGLPDEKYDVLVTITVQHGERLSYKFDKFTSASRFIDRYDQIDNACVHAYPGKSDER